jgi:hypothetical protein
MLAKCKFSVGISVKIPRFVEASETRGTTALVYCLIGSSLYTGTVQGCWSTPPTGLTVGRGEVHPNWSDGQQGCSQLSTDFLFSANRA